MEGERFSVSKLTLPASCIPTAARVELKERDKDSEKDEIGIKSRKRYSLRITVIIWVYHSAKSLVIHMRFYVKQFDVRIGIPASRWG